MWFPSKAQEAASLNSGMASGYFAPLRTTKDIVLYLSPKRPVPIAVPFELQNQISPDEWAFRIQAISKTTSRYSRPLFERIWTFVGFLTTLILPVALFQLVVVQLLLARNHDSAGLQVEARAISFGIFVGVALFFLVPIAVWKYLGRRQVNGLLQRWSKADSARAGTSFNPPVWKVNGPGIFRDSTILTIELPSPPLPTAFTPGAYLPPYINGPSDADANYFYPYKSEPGLPRMSVVGNVPLYVDEKRGYDDVRV